MKTVIGLASTVILLGMVGSAPAVTNVDRQQVPAYQEAADVQAEEPIDNNTADADTLTELKALV